MVTVPLALPVAFGGKLFHVMVTEAVFTGLPFIFTPVSTVPVVVPPCVPLGCVKVVGVGCLFAHWVCNIDPFETYSWYSGIWHGIFFIPNLVRSWFGDTLYKAELYTTGYNVFWWLTVVWMVMSIIISPFSNNRN